MTQAQLNQSHISEAMRDAVGAEIGRSISYPVGENDIRRWAIATYWPQEPPSRFIDAPADGSPMVAPEEFNVMSTAWRSASSESSATAITKQVDGFNSDLTENQVGVEGPGLKNMLNGGMTVEYGAPIHAGDVITSVRTLGEYAEREGRLGQMLFSTTVDTWTNQDGAFVKRSTMTLIRY
jgi:hypothetical protein